MIPRHAGLVTLIILLAGFLTPAVASSRTITVTGEALVRVVPDEVVITLGVETRDMSLAVAKKDNDERVRKVLESAKNNGIEPKHLQTDFISIQPRYDHHDVFLGYLVRKTIVITLKDVPKFEKTVSDALEAGANYIHGVQFQTTELRKYRDQARAMAIKAAVEKANDLSAALGHKVGKPQSIQEPPTWWWSSYASGWGARHTQAAQNVIQEFSGNQGAVDQTVAPGMIGVGAKVTITFDLE